VAAVPITVYGPKPAGLTVRAELVQLSSSLAAPVRGDIEVSLAASATPTAFASALDLSVSLPAVSRETDFELRFQASWPAARAELAAGRVALRVYPASLLDPLRLWAESHAIRLADDHGSVTALFRDARVRLANGPGPSDLVVYSGSRFARTGPLRSMDDGRATIVFAERDATPPYLVVERAGRRTTVRVEMRILDRLATDPLAQKILLEAFRHAVMSDRATTLEGAVR
jgi:hypothetical protein